MANDLYKIGLRTPQIYKYFVNILINQKKCYKNPRKKNKITSDRNPQLKKYIYNKKDYITKIKVHFNLKVHTHDCVYIRLPGNTINHYKN